MNFMKLQLHVSKSCFSWSCPGKLSNDQRNTWDFFDFKDVLFFSSEKEKIKTIAGGFKHFFIFTPNPGEDEPFLSCIFFRWVETTNQIKMFPKTGVSDLGIRCLFVGSDSVQPKFVVGIALPRPSTSFHDYGRAEEVEKTSDSQFGWRISGSHFRVGARQKQVIIQSHIFIRCIWGRHLIFLFLLGCAFSCCNSGRLLITLRCFSFWVMQWCWIGFGGPCSQIIAIVENIRVQHHDLDEMPYNSYSTICIQDMHDIIWLFCWDDPFCIPLFCARRWII